MTQAARRGIACLALVAVAACSGKRISDIDSGTATPTPDARPWSVPAGVVTRPSDRGARVLAGLYPSIEAGDRHCCWIAPDATIETYESSTATLLTLTVFVPDYPFFERGGQSLSVGFPGFSQTWAALAPGVHRLRIDLPAGRRHSGNLAITLRASRAFVPAHEGFNADTRALGIILLGIAAT